MPAEYAFLVRCVPSVLVGFLWQKADCAVHCGAELSQKVPFLIHKGA
jgi:hypothetical protein